MSEVTLPWAFKWLLGAMALAFGWWNRYLHVTIRELEANKLDRSAFDAAMRRRDTELWALVEEIRRATDKADLRGARIQERVDAMSTTLTRLTTIEEERERARRAATSSHAPPSPPPLTD